MIRPAQRGNPDWILLGAVLGLTANVVPQDLQKFSAAGANLLALKPFVRERLLAQIARLLHPSRT